MARGSGLDSWGFNSQQGKNFSLFQSIETDCGGHPASYPMGNWGGGGVKGQTH
jgi:hypothetical protein